MQNKVTPATPILVVIIILLMAFLFPPCSINTSSTMSSSSSSNTSSIEVSTSSSSASTSTSASSSTAASSSAASSSTLAPDEIYRNKHQNTIDLGVDEVTIDDKSAIEEALNDYDALDQDSKDKLTDEKAKLDALYSKILQLESFEKLNGKKTIVQDFENGGGLSNIPVCAATYEEELTTTISNALNDATITISVVFVMNSKYEVEIVDVETGESIAFEVTATFTPCPGYQDKQDIRRTKEAIDERIASGYFLNLPVANLNLSSMEAAVLDRVADLATEYGTTITIIDGSRNGSTFNFTFVVSKGLDSETFSATATFVVGV